MKREPITSIQQLPILVDVNTFANLMQVSRATAYRIIANEEIPTVNFTSKIQINKKDLIEWLTRHFGDLG